MFAERATTIDQVPQSRTPEATTSAEKPKNIVDSVVRIKHANFPSQGSPEESDTLYDLWTYYATMADYLKDRLWTTGPG